MKGYLLNSVHNKEILSVLEKIEKCNKIFIQIDALIKKVDAKKEIKTLDEAYRAIAELELLTANSLIKYSNAMKYGVLNPKKIYARYYVETKRPDMSAPRNAAPTVA